MKLLPRAVAGPRFVSDAPLRVAPDLIGAPLASPARRAPAMLVDLAVIGVLSSASGAWLAAALLLLAVQLRRALATEGVRPRVAMLVLAVVVGAAACTAFEAWQSASEPAPAKSAKRAAAPRTAASGPAAPAVGEAASDAERIARLEAEIARIRAAAAERPRWRDALDAALDDIGLSFGWGLVYFSLLPVWWPGRTLGKRLLGLRIVELSGQPLTPLRGLKRYGGYAAGMATGGLGFLQLLWEPNRQALHDRAAHTVVIDVRRLPAAP